MLAEKELDEVLPIIAPIIKNIVASSNPHSLGRTSFVCFSLLNMVHLLYLLPTFNMPAGFSFVCAVSAN